jgi:hypothetical protein
MELISTPCVAWRASTSYRVVIPARQAVNRFLGSLKTLQIRALRKIRGNVTKVVTDTHGLNNSNAQTYGGKSYGRIFF